MQSFISNVNINVKEMVTSTSCTISYKDVSAVYGYQIFIYYQTLTLVYRKYIFMLMVV